MKTSFPQRRKEKRKKKMKKSSTCPLRYCSYLLVHAEPISTTNTYLHISAVVPELKKENPLAKGNARLEGEASKDVIYPG